MRYALHVAAIGGLTYVIADVLAVVAYHGALPLRVSIALALAIGGLWPRLK
jgi:hypothetical protein